MNGDDIKIYKVGNLTIKIDRSKCLSCGSCTAVAPNTFEIDDELISTVKAQGPLDQRSQGSGRSPGSYDEPEKIKEAAEGCSGGAITISTIEQP
jgi:ferredoxin